MNRTDQEIRSILATFRRPDRARYPELAGYTADELYQDLVGGGGLYLAARMARTLELQPGANVDPFDLQVCLDQIEWGRVYTPAKTLFVLTARKL